VSNHYHIEMVLYNDPQHYCVLRINEEPFELHSGPQASFYNPYHCTWTTRHVCSELQVSVCICNAR